MRGFIVSTIIACLFWPQLLLAALPQGLAGDWQGVVEIDGAKAPLRLALVDRGQGFEIDFDVPGAAPLRARLVPSEQARVFEVAAASRGLFGFFDGGDRSNPFDGAPLIWARASGIGIVAYRLAIAADGGMALLRIALEPMDDQMRVSVEQRVDARPPQRFEALIERAG